MVVAGVKVGVEAGALGTSAEGGKRDEELPMGNGSSKRLKRLVRERGRSTPVVVVVVVVEEEADWALVV